MIALFRTAIICALILVKHGKAFSICNSDACNAISERILGYMDQTTRPCDDFYRFACRKFEDSADIPEHQTQNSSFTQVYDRLEDQLRTIVYEKPDPSEPWPYRNLRHLFSLCMDERTINARGIDHALSRIQEAGGWPVLGNWREENWNFLDTEIMLWNLSIGGDSLFDISVSTDIKNTTRRIIEIDQVGLGLAREFLVRGVNDPIVKAYYSYMVDIAVLYGAERTTAAEQLRKSLFFEIELAKLTKPREERREYDRMYNPFGLQDLKTTIGWIDWERLLRSLMPNSVPLRDNELIIVNEVDYLKKLEGLLHSHSKEVIANHMMWHAARGLTGALTEAMRNRSQEYKTVVIGTTAREPRWKECIGVAGSLGIALSSLYVKKFFDKNSKKEALDMAERIRQEIYKDIQEVDWMDNMTSARASYKALQVKEFIGYPDELMDISKIESHYEGLVIDGEHYFEALLTLSRWGHNYGFRLLREPVNKTDWRTHSNVALVNAFYHPLENSMQFPAGILQHPFFDAQAPKFVNYAAIGSIMAHEITHGFDDQGSQFDFNGDLKEWWTEESKKIFNEKKKCFIEQYSNFKDTLTLLHLNGINTQGENVADNGAVKLAYRAYKRLELEEPILRGLESYTQDQIFILSMANMWCTKYRPQALKYQITTGVHPPSEFRVNGALKNFPEFSKIFKCSKDDPMNPQKKCAIW